MRRFTAALIIFFINCSAQSAEKVYWLTDNKDEIAHVKSGEPYSIGTDTLRLVLDALQDFDIELQFASIERMNASLKRTDNICVANRIKTPARESENYFSTPLNMHPLARLYFLEHSFNVPDELVNDVGELSSISDLMKANPDKKLGLNKAVSYGPDLDSQIGAVSPGSVTFFDADNRYVMGIKLLLDGLIDVSLFYPTQVSKHASLSENSHQLTSLLVAQENQYVVTHIACSRSANGKRVIEQVDRVLNSLYRSNEHLQAHLRHMPVKEQASFADAYQKQFLNLGHSASL